MTMPASTLNALTSHTFGREHRSPPPWGAQMQAAPNAPVAPSPTVSTPEQAGVLPDDFDYLVRSVGEW